MKHSLAEIRKEVGKKIRNKSRTVFIGKKIRKSRYCCIYVKDKGGFLVG